jgi:hypothetical protein
MMKKLLRALAMMLALLLFGSAIAEDSLRGYSKKDGYVYLTFGSFPQTKEGGIEPILWRVLGVKDGQAYLLSEYVLEARRIHGDEVEYNNKPTNSKKPGIDGDFTKTEMSLYLNGDFTDHFTEGELALIARDDTLGLFFLASGEDLKNKNYGFTSDQSRKAWGTEYAKENGLFVYGSSRGNHSPYWTRDRSSSYKYGARCIKSKGELGYINVITLDEGMRPGCYLDMDKVIIASGEGTMEDPYVLLTTETAVPAPEAPAAGEAAEATNNECNCVPEGEKCDCCDCCSCSRR